MYRDRVGARRTSTQRQLGRKTDRYRNRQGGRQRDREQDGETGRQVRRQQAMAV